MKLYCASRITSSTNNSMSVELPTHNFPQNSIQAGIIARRQKLANADKEVLIYNVIQLLLYGQRIR